MIIVRLKHLMKNCSLDQLAFDQLVDEFRGERDATELLEVLNCQDDELVRIGTWILSEIAFSKYDSEDFKNRLYELTTHPLPAVRMHSLNALFPLLSLRESRSRALIERLKADDNEGVRMMAEAAANQLNNQNQD